jgi:hypothetical protein
MGKWRRVLSVVLQWERYLAPRLRNRAIMLPNLSTSFRRLLATGPAGDRFGTIIAACGYVPEFKYVISSRPGRLHYVEFAPVYEGETAKQQFAHELILAAAATFIVLATGVSADSEELLF